MTAHQTSLATLSRLTLVLVALLSVGATCGEPAKVAVTVRDATTGSPTPARIVVFRSSDQSAATVRSESSGTNIYVSTNFFELGSGAGTLALDPGTYDLYATAGPEWTLEKKAGVAVSGTGGALEFQIQRVVGTAGYIACDFHIHSYASYDGQIPVRQRVITYLVEGVEVMGAADHDCVTDYGPTISSLGLSSRITSMRGVEATPAFVTNTPDASGNCRSAGVGQPDSEHGHWNAFPLRAGITYDTSLDEGVNAATLYDRLRGLQSERLVIQLNHPHWDAASLRLDWFEVDNMNFRPTLPVPETFGNGTAPNAFLRKPSTIAGSPTQGIDFDAIEILGGGQSQDWLQTRTDWFALLNQGFLKVGTANSDSHGMARTAGYARTYVKVPDDTPAGVTPEDIRDHLLAGQALGTTGPFIRLTVDGSGLGALVRDTDGEVSVDLKVSAAPWIEVGEVRIARNGIVVWSQSLPVQDPEPVVRYDGTVSIPVTKDSWILAEAGSSLPANVSDPMYIPALMKKLVPTNLVPWGFTNPIYVDRDGDGVFTPPGL